MRRRLFPTFLLLVLFAPAAHGSTARDLSARFTVDGFTNDFAADEAVFGFNGPRNVPEESTSDSKWGPDNDVWNLRVTWDAQFLYLAGEAVTWGNNLVILLDPLPGQGLTTMRNLNSWSRNFSFDADSLNPDLFGATWDTNTLPRLIVHQGGQLGGLQVTDNQPGALFEAAATFSTNQRGRAMEFKIPWNTLFLGSEGFGTRDTVMTVAGRTDTLRRIPRGARLKLAAVITSGGDNTGGPDCAPDNSNGLSSDGSLEVFLDNYAVIDLDRRDDTGLGGGGPDGIADWNVDVKPRVSFRIDPPVEARPAELAELRWLRPAFAPDRGETADFCVRFKRRDDPAFSDPCRSGRGLDTSIFDVRGRLVRKLSLKQVGSNTYSSNPVDQANGSLASYLPEARWDGRDDAGRIVDAGIYILSVVLESNTGTTGRLTRPVVVAR